MYHVRDGVIGLAIGDAMGVPTEGNKREILLAKPVVKMLPKISAGIPKGAWSDNTSLSIATIDAISKSGINYTAMGDNYVRWFTTNQFCSINESFGVSNTTLKSLVRYTQRLEEAYECGSDDYYDNGNDPLCRCLPLAYYFNVKKDTDKKILEVVKRVCSITHKHEVAVLGCYIYVRFLMYLLKGINKHSALNQVRKLDFSMFNKSSLDEYKRILVADINEFDIDEIKNSSFIVDTLEAAIWCFMKSESFKECAIATTNIGGDTPTIGAIAGSLAGIFYGYSNIPKSYLEDLRKRDYLIDISENYESFLRHM
jgi:ADP-ribosylglycohydrolase